MADSKITALTALTSADPANDMIPIVDVSDTPPASGNTKRISINNLLACSPSATLASATITGDLTVDTSTLKVDSTNNRVGIGTATPGAYALDLKSTTAAAQLRIFGSNQNSITFGNAAGGASNGFLMGRSFNSDDGNNFFVYDITSSALRFFIGTTGNLGIGTNSPTEAVVLNSGNLKLTNGNVVMGTSGKGIDFSATASGSGTMTSELLNDYEEGTWVGTYVFATTPQTSTNTFTGRYTKVGRIVTVQGTMLIAPGGFVKGPGAGQLQLTGLPFAVQDAAVLYQDLAASVADINTGSFCFCSIAAGGTSFGFESMGVVGAVVQRNSSSITAANFAATNAGYITISLNFNYTVA